MNIDQKLKERLVGMAVLMFIGIIVIPWVLDGETQTAPTDNGLSLPVPESMQTRDLNLQDGSIKVVTLPNPELNNDDRQDTQESNDTTTVNNSTNAQTSVQKSQDSNLKVATSIQTEKPVAAKPKVDTPKQKSADKPADKPVDKPVTNPTVKPKESNSNDSVSSDPLAAWAVQIGSFSERANAEKEVLRLKEKGFPSFLSRFQNDAGRVLYRVRVGPEKDRARADKLLERLEKSGFKAKVLPHP